MEIQNTHNQNSIRQHIKKKFSTRLILLIVLSLLGLFCFGFVCVIYGAYLNKTGQTPILRMFIHRLLELNTSFVPKHVRGEFADIETVSIDIKFKNWEKIRYFREKALFRGRITPDIEKKIPAKIRYNGRSYRVDLGLTGQTLEHLKHPDKWSLSVKVKDGDTIMGMKKFALLFPRARGYLTDWIATELLKSQGVIGLRSDFVDVSVNGNNKGLFYLEERFDKRLIENNRFREGLIFKLLGNGLKVYGLKQVSKNEELSAQLTELKQLMHGFLSGKVNTQNLFDLEKFASLFVVSDLMNQKHAIFWSNLRLYFNPVTNLIEPIGREWGYLRKETKSNMALSIEKPNAEVAYHLSLHQDPVLRKIFNSFEFKAIYIKQAIILSQQKYLDRLFVPMEEKIQSLLEKIYKENPFYEFPIELLKENQEYIRNALHPKLPFLDVNCSKVGKDSFQLAFGNKLDLPVEIHYLKHGEQKIIPEKRLILKSSYNSLNIDQNMIFKFTGEMKQQDSFTPDLLTVYYSVLGTNDIRQAIGFKKKMTKNDYLQLNPSRQPSNIYEFSFLEIDNITKQIKFPNKKCDIANDMIIPPGYTVAARPGCIINLKNSAKIISYSPLYFWGEENNLITVTSSDSTGQGIVALNCKRISEMSYVNFSRLSNISDTGWNLRGAVTFYESPININHCEFKDNIRGDDYLNIIRTNYTISNTVFEKIFADALDSDFCSGTLENVNFRQVGNDAIDISGTMLHATDVDIINTGDKGISAGEGSNLIGSNIKIIEAEIAVASKDNSIVEITGIDIESSKLAYCVFQKKSEYGPGKIIVNSGILKNVDVDFLVEVGSYMSLNGNQILKKENKVKEILYGKKYGKSSK